jgi:hypothetical protein
MIDLFWVDWQKALCLAGPVEAGAVASGELLAHYLLSVN